MVVRGDRRTVSAELAWLRPVGYGSALIICLVAEVAFKGAGGVFLIVNLIALVLLLQLIDSSLPSLMARELVIEASLQGIDVRIRSNRGENRPLHSWTPEDIRSITCAAKRIIVTPTKGTQYILATLGSEAEAEAARLALFAGLARCATCDYDLRATPARCPECGAVPESGVSATASHLDLA